MRWRGIISRPLGFTLLELVLVLAIIAIALAVAAPALAGFVKGRSPVNTAGEFVAVAHWARSQAITDSVTYHLNIDTSAKQWWVTKDNGTTFVQVDDAFGRPFTLPDDVKIDTDAPRGDGTNAQVITFDPSGRSDPGTVHFTSTKGAGSADVVCETPIDLYHLVEPQGGR